VEREKEADEVASGEPPALFETRRNFEPSTHRDSSGSSSTGSTIAAMRSTSRRMPRSDLLKARSSVFCKQRSSRPRGDLFEHLQDR
jgi:hypothetical protein